MGHEERFPPTRLSAGCGFRKETIVGMRRNGEMRRKHSSSVLPGTVGLEPSAASEHRPVREGRSG
jgi:hypothetical protein